MSIIKYTVKFKRILTANVRENGKVVSLRIGEVTSFKQNIDGTLDIVAKIWPQTSPSLKKEIEKNPGIMGMMAEPLPVSDHLVFPDGSEVS